jgi:acetaldehyde dehydrogenase
MATKVAIIGSGNIGTDLMIKVIRTSKSLEMGAMAGIDASSDGLARAARLGVPVTSDGVPGLVDLPEFDDIEIIFDATSAGAHLRNWGVLEPLGRRVIDLTPAAVGPYVVPVVNMDEHLDAPNVNMVTCGGQATIPIVAAVAAVTGVHYAEIVASIARHGKAIIVLNPAEPPLIMRDTVYCLVSADAAEADIAASVTQMVAKVQEYVPGYRLKQAVQFERFSPQQPLRAPEIGFAGAGLKVSVFLEVEGAAHYLPAYAGNLDIMTSAALRTAERIAARKVVPA